MSDQPSNDEQLMDQYLREHFGVEPSAYDTLGATPGEVGELTEEEALASYRDQHFPRDL